MKSQRKAVKALTDYSSNTKPEIVMEKLGISSVSARWKTIEVTWLGKFSSPNYLENLIPLRQNERSLREDVQTEANCKTAFGDSMLCRRVRALSQKLLLSNEIWKCQAIKAFKKIVTLLLSLLIVLSFHQI